MHNKIVDENFLRNAGLKPTKQRLMLSKIVFSAKNKHFSANDVKKTFLKKGQTIALATIYNNLNQFTNAGLLKQRNLDNNKSYFENNMSEHFHYYDEEKDILIDIPSSDIKFSKLPKLPKGKKIKNIDLVINLIKK